MGVLAVVPIFRVATCFALSFYIGEKKLGLLYVDLGAPVTKFCFTVSSFLVMCHRLEHNHQALDFPDIIVRIGKRKSLGNSHTRRSPPRRPPSVRTFVRESVVETSIIIIS